MIPIAGDQVTNDIAIALRTPTQNAEEIKLKYGCAMTTVASSEEMVEVPGVGDRPRRRISRHGLAEVIEPRYEELFRLVQAELRRSGYEDTVASGIVLTGGASQMKGAVELAEDIFRMPVRLGIPQGVDGLSEILHNPVYATSVGLLLSGKHRLSDRRGMVPPNAGIKDLWGRMRSWFQGNF